MEINMSAILYDRENDWDYVISPSCEIIRADHVSAPHRIRIAGRLVALAIAVSPCRAVSCIKHYHRDASLIIGSRSARRYERTCIYVCMPSRARCIIRWLSVESRTRTILATFSSLSRRPRRARSIEKCRGTLKKVCVYGRFTACEILCQ